jgi:hypothetical protein
MILKNFWSILLSLVGISCQAAVPAAENDWWLARTKEGGNELLYRVRATLPAEATIARYPFLAIVDWVYSARADGMPDRDTSSQMYALEDVIEQKLEKVSSATLAFTLTGNGKKQWNYYVADKSGFEAIVAAEVHRKSNLPVQVRFVSDP